ncbi:MAG TPA: HAD family hydrolase [Opitutaceae bacterium]|jgi:FMN phosphatase YigB (HAD superfamily)
MSSRSVAFLFDVDNTLLDNDRVVQDMKAYLRRKVGDEAAQRYWTIFDRTRAELSYVDYLGSLQEARREMPRELHFQDVSRYLINYAFAQRLYPDALDVIDRVKAWGQAAILSDGDVVFQPRKIERSGLWDAVDGHVMIYVHKETEADEVLRRYPADHYVLFDDKLRLLTAFKRLWGPRITTAWVRQGHYGLDPKSLAENPPPDLTLERIGDVLALDPAVLMPEA